MTSVEARESSAAVVFGGRSPIAVSCAQHLAETQDVVLVTRRIDDDIQRLVGSKPRLVLVEADLELVGESRRVIESIYASGYEVSAAVFLQRYRPADEVSFEAHARVELWSIQEALEAIRDRKARRSEVHVLVSSSPAAQKVVVGQDLRYHVVKAGQEALVRFMAVELCASRIRINAVQVGSIVIKERAESYWASVPHVTAGLRGLYPDQSLPTSETVGREVATLASGMSTLSGQILPIDGGVGLRDGIQMAKQALESLPEG